MKCSPCYKCCEGILVTFSDVKVALRKSKFDDVDVLEFANNEQTCDGERSFAGLYFSGL